MSEFAIGQRWVSHTETELGLGIVHAIETRKVKIYFPATNEERLYAIHNAPLARIAYNAGESIQTQDKKTHRILKVESHLGRLRYHAQTPAGHTVMIDEQTLDHIIDLRTPKQRLSNAQLEPIAAYQLRCATLVQLHHLQQSTLYGLCGSRTNLLPHQIYIANEVARRYAPRVLLADEAGLGKTIEAGMILHYQLLTGLAKRVLIIVPETLTHQWLIEMRRKFNLYFALLNKARLQATESNPFDSEQLIICSMESLTTEPECESLALDVDWDMVIVDEAHHLHWTDGEAGHDYRCIEALAKKCRGLLLLTATPEQVGIASHFARLRLLDPARFETLENFLTEQQGYQQLSDIVSALQTTKSLSVTIQNQLRQYVDDPITNDLNPEKREPIIRKLLDQYGTGRVLLRNTRQTITGFPARNLIPIALSAPAIYTALTGAQTLFPEIYVTDEQWLQHDPRVAWLIEQLKQLRPQKVLVICAHAQTAMHLEKKLKLSTGIRSAVFYEDLSIIERDRAAAYFADLESGAQVLICSEIGSEGRNFQFAHNLVLFDLPQNPDLLEQRIGRLDRIGQTKTINIYVPYLDNTAQATLFKWYEQGLNLFVESCAAAYAIYEHFELELTMAFKQNNTDISALLDNTCRYTKAMKKTMQAGRNRLIELNSCRTDIANDLIDQIKQAQNSTLLMDYLALMFDVYGVEHEAHSEQTWILHPSDNMREAYFPGLGDDSLTITFNRDKALQREDFSFISWEHPMTVEAMQMVLDSELGNATIATIARKDMPAGTILLETFASINAIAPKQLQLGRYLPLTPLRTLISQDGKDYTKTLSHETLNILCQAIDQQTACAIIKQIKIEIETIVNIAMKLTTSTLPDVKQAATAEVQTLLTIEIERLQQLKQKNHSIRPEEIETLQTHRAACTEAIAAAYYELQAVRLIIAT